MDYSLFIHRPMPSRIIFLMMALSITQAAASCDTFTECFDCQAQDQCQWQKDQRKCVVPGSTLDPKQWSGKFADCPRPQVSMCFSNYSQEQQKNETDKSFEFWMKSLGAKARYANQKYIQ